jgi:succinate-semialdehyde dehydrogenase/glutarate-semialdehyde dehydrogenase
MYYAGRWQQGQGTERIALISPANESVLGEIPQATSADVAAATERACAGLRAMRLVPAWERSALLRNAAALLRERARSIGLLVANEIGKPIAQATGEANAAAEAIEWFAGEASRIFGLSYESPVPGDRYRVNFAPVGVVAAFTPWNFPLLLLARKLAPTLAAGCSFISRPSHEGAGCTMALIECFIDAGFPVGAGNLLTDNPEIIAQDLMADPRVAKISSTGSVPVGKQLIAQAAQTVKRVSMELGGHAPVIVHEDTDVDALIAAAVQAKFRNAGQVCASPTRFYIHRSVLGKAVAGMAERTKLLRVGDPLRDDTEVGPLATQRRCASVAALVEDAVAAGATLNAGGRQPDAA